MSRADDAQFNIRSRYARDRAAALARQTGLTATQIVEDALRAYLPPGDGTAGGALQREGAILVRPAAGRTITLSQAEAAREDLRAERS